MNSRGIIVILILAILILGSYILGMRNGSVEQIVTDNHRENTIQDEKNYHHHHADLSLSKAEQETIDLFEQSSPSIVYINTANIRRDWSFNLLEIPQGTGSGFIWDEEGHIVTNFHVIDGADRYKVTLSNQESYDAELVGVAPGKDLAVLKLKGINQDLLKPISQGNSANLRVGQTVFAIGNPFGLDYSLTQGIISALSREIQAKNGQKITDVIQTDAAINPGNSGGPLLDSRGQLIGVNTAIYSPSGAYAGIGFSIPVDVVKWVVSDLLNYGRINRPILGIDMLPENYKNSFGITTGVMVADIRKGMPAARAGLRPLTRDRRGNWRAGDIITSINDEKIATNNDLLLLLEKYEAGDKIKLGVIRNRELFEVELTLASSL